MNDNICILSDGYKISHWRGYPKGLQKVHSYLESRGGLYSKTLFFGLQYFLNVYFVGRVVTQDKINEAEEFWKVYFGSDTVFNREGWEYIANKHDGKLPLVIKAIPEGTLVDFKNVLLTIENTDENCGWLVNYIETVILNIWYTITISSQEYEVRQNILRFLNLSGSPETIDYKVVDFGFRGVTCPEQAALGAAAHLISSKVTDTVAGIRLLNKYYNAQSPGISIPATEHSVICSFGPEGEIEAYKNWLNAYPDGPIACVSDTYNIFNACENIWGGVLKEDVLKRKGALIVRPDCHSEDTEILTSKGWKFFKNLVNEDLVAEFDLQDNIRFVKPLKLIKELYSGEMIHFTDIKGRLDALVTPNHKMLQICKNKEFKVCEAKNFTSYHLKDFIRAGIKAGGREGLTPEERLLIAFQADGHRVSGKSIIFNFAKKRKTKRLLSILKMLPYEYRVEQLTNIGREGQDTITVKVNKELPKTFSWVDLNEISYSWAREFTEELSYWDATRRTGTRFKYDTTVEENAHLVQAVCVLAGYGCSYSVFKDNRKECFSDVHSLTILTHKRKIGGQSIRKGIVKYTGYVYCVTVPSGFIITRRNRKVIIAGNSGEPNEIVPEILTILWSKFGGEMNAKGFRVLDSHIRVIQGDNMNPKTINSLYEKITSLGWSADNLAVGSGGGMLMKVNRDTNKFAIKASAVKINDKWIDIYKNPVTQKDKQSKRGRLKLIKENGEYKTVRLEEPGEDQLVEVFRDGKILKQYTFDEVRKNAGTSL